MGLFCAALLVCQILVHKQRDVVPRVKDSLTINAQTVTADLKDVSLSAALNTVFNQAHSRWRLSHSARSLADHDRCSIHLVDVKLERALDAILNASRGTRPRLVCKKEAGVYVIDLPRISIKLTGKSISAALKSLFSTCDLDYVYWSQEGRNFGINLSLTDVPFDQALDRIMAQAGGSFRYVLERRQGVCILRPAVSDRFPWSDAHTRVSVRFSFLDGASAADALFGAFGMSYVVSMALDKPVTYEKSDYSFEGCLEGVLDGIDKNLTFTLEDSGRGGLAILQPRTGINFTGR